MAHSTSIFLCSLLVLLLFVLPSSSTNILDDLRSMRSNFPSVLAKKMIRELNLFPNEDVNIRHWAANSSIDPKSKLVEKPLRFPNLVAGNDSGASIQDLGHHAGYYKIQHSNAGRMFYFFFESRGAKGDPVVIWLTGGPGCGSELALFYENGPFKITDNLSLTWNEYGWDKASNILFVDQPIGTGFSYATDASDIPHTEDGVSNDLYDFLQAFFAAHPQFAKNDFYIAGESYAGHYIPALATRIQTGNKAKEGVHINLKGFAIGNGLTNPAIQYKAYPDFALQVGLIQQSDYDQINRSLVPACEMAAKLCGTNGTMSCTRAFVVCENIFSKILLRHSGINVYDIRKKCVGSLCYDFSNLEKFLNQQSVRDALGVGNSEFVSCSSTVHEAMLVDIMRNLEAGIPALLENGINMLVYAGEYDLICNWLGNSRWVQAMEWSGQKDFVASPEVPFVVDGVKAGLLKSHGPVSFIKVLNAGHLVPMDQPKAALEMLTKWTKGTLAKAQ